MPSTPEVSEKRIRRHTKADLVNLLHEAGALEYDESDLKETLVTALESQLRRHATKLSRLTKFEGFYEATSASPTAVAAPLTSSDAAPVSSRIRRHVLVKREAFDSPSSPPLSENAAAEDQAGIENEDDEDLKSSAQRRRARVLASLESEMMANANGQRQSVRDLQTTATTRRAGKASPVTTALRSRDPVSAIARKYNTSNAVSAQATTTQPYRQKRLSDLTTLYQSGRDVVKREISSRDVLAGVDGNLLSTLRDRCSTFLFVQSLIILCEATLLSISLLSRTLAVNTGDPLGHSFELPAPIHGLDLHLLFSLHFWVPFLIWAATSVLLPAAAGSIFNFTRRRTQVDPVGFNLVKAILAIFMLGQGLAGPGRVARLQIEKAFPGGWRFILTDCLVAGIVAFWDGVQLQGQVINHAAR